MTSEITQLSPAQWFHKHKELLGFTNLSRALFMSVRELVENSLTACEESGIMPHVKIELHQVSDKVYRLQVSDNGPGMPEKVIPKALGSFLVSHFSLKQSRSIFGVGGKAVILGAQATTASPATIISSTDGKAAVKLTIEIDVKENKAKIMDRSEISAKGRGLSIEVVTGGDYGRAGSSIKEYLKQTAIVSPYADILFRDPDGNVIHYKSITGRLPLIPKVMPPHPHGVDVELVKALIAESKKMPVANLLKHKFQRIGPKVAAEICSAAGVTPNANTKSLTTDEIRRLVGTMASYRFMRPDASGLAPVDAENFKAGIDRAFAPAWSEAVLRKPSSYGGYPFQVTVCIAYGGDTIPAGVELLRFANLIPLIYDESGDVSKKVVNETDWRRYHVDPNNDKVLVAVSVVSVKPPYRTAGKEMLGDVDELEQEIRLGILDIARKLLLYISSQTKREASKKRQEIYEKYVPLALKFLSQASGEPVKVVKK